MRKKTSEPLSTGAKSRARSVDHEKEEETSPSFALLFQKALFPQVRIGDQQLPPVDEKQNVRNRVPIT